MLVLRKQLKYSMMLLETMMKIALQDASHQ